MWQPSPSSLRNLAPLSFHETPPPPNTQRVLDISVDNSESKNDSGDGHNALQCILDYFMSPRKRMESVVRIHYSQSFNDSTRVICPLLNFFRCFKIWVWREKRSCGWWPIRLNLHLLRFSHFIEEGEEKKKICADSLNLSWILISLKTFDTLRFFANSWARPKQDGRPFRLKTGRLLTLPFLYE